MDMDSQGESALILLQPNLLSDEKILWSGKPEPKLFTAADFFLIPFGAFFFCFSVFWIYMASGIPFHANRSSNHESIDFPIPFALFGIPFVLVGFYILFGRFFFKNWKQRNTYYAVTNQRVLILSTVPNQSLQALFIDVIPVLNKSVNSSGAGTITFGNSDPRAAMYANTGMDSFTSVGGMGLAPAFYNIKDANNVYALINSQRGSQRSGN